MNQQEVRLEALRLAIVNASGLSPEETTDLAEAYFQFLMRGNGPPARLEAVA